MGVTLERALEAVEGLTEEQMRSLLEKRQNTSKAVQDRSIVVDQLSTMLSAQQEKITEVSRKTVKVAVERKLDTMSRSRMWAAGGELALAVIGREQMTPDQYRTLISPWVEVIPELADEFGVGSKQQEEVREELPAPATVERAAPRTVTPPKQQKQVPKNADQPKPKAEPKQRAKAEPTARAVKGNPESGVRIRASRIKEGKFYVSEGDSKRKVAPGYFESIDEAKKVVHKNHWKLLGVIEEVKHRGETQQAS